MIAVINWSGIGHGLGAAVAYLAVAVVILIIGYVITDLTTPGKLSSLICDDRNVNATIIAVTNLVAVATIIVMAIWHTDADFSDGLVTTSVFGLLGVILLALTDLIVDKLTPGDLPVLVTDARFHPASVFVGATHLIVGVLIAVCIV